MNEVTQILGAIERGDPKAAAELLPLVYEELRRLAAYKMSHEPPGQTLQPTALVHEAWLRLAGGSQQQSWQSRAHFFGAAAEAMRRILIDIARRKQARRHGGGQVRVDAIEADLAAPLADEELLAVNDALERFAAVEAASALGISEPTVKRWWTYARAWLLNEIKAR
jgi:RNA polymerase sigma factor (TIGR02999 family)